MFHGHLDYFQKPPLGGRPNTKPGDHGTPYAHNRRFILFYNVRKPHEYRFIEKAFGWRPGHTWLHTRLEGPWSHYMIWEVGWDGLWTLSFGLSQCHGHGSWLMCEVALRALAGKVLDGPTSRVYWVIAASMQFSCLCPGPCQPHMYSKMKATGSFLTESCSWAHSILWGTRIHFKCLFGQENICHG